MFGSLLSGLGQGATGFAQLAGAFDPDLPRRSIDEEVRTTLGTTGKIYRNAARWQPQFEQLNRGVMNSSLFGGPLVANGSTPGYAEMLTGLFDYLAPRLTETQRNLNPQATAGLDALLRGALEDYNSGLDLSPAELRNLQQSMRGQQAARGFGFSPADAGYESLAQLAAGQNLRQQRMGNLSSALSQVHAQTPNPFALGQSLMGMGMGASQAAASRLVDPFNSYAQDLYNTNYNAKAYEELATIENRKQAAQNITAGAAAIGNAAGGGMGGGMGMGGGNFIGSMAGGGGGGSSWFGQAPVYASNHGYGMPSTGFDFNQNYNRNFGGLS